jgi:hypothetical protein
VHQIVAAADLDELDAALGELRTAGWPDPEDPEAMMTRNWAAPGPALHVGSRRDIEFRLYRAKTRTLALSWCFCAHRAALRYSLIRPWTTCLCLIRAVTSIGWPGSCSGGRCSRDW